MRWILVDRIVECVPGVQATAIKCFSRSDIIFLDHLRGEPVVPGVLLVEMIANAASFCYRLSTPASSPRLGIIKAAKFYKPVVPGDQCRIRVSLTKSRADYLAATGTVEVDGAVVAEAEIVSAILPAEKPFEDPVLTEWLSQKVADQVPSS